MPPKTIQTPPLTTQKEESKKDEFKEQHKE